MGLPTTLGQSLMEAGPRPHLLRWVGGWTSSQGPGRGGLEGEQSPAEAGHKRRGGRSPDLFSLTPHSPRTETGTDFWSLSENVWDPWDKLYMQYRISVTPMSVSVLAQQLVGR